MLKSRKPLAGMMDDLDRRLLRTLRADARASYTAMAKDLGVSEGTVRARLKRLVEDGTIRRFTIRTRGADVRGLVEVTVAANVHAGAVAAAIRDWDGVEAVWETTGETDLFVVAECPTTGHLNDLIDRIRTIDGTEATRSRLILKEH